MTKKDYELIAGALWRSNRAKSLIGNKVERTASLRAIELVANDLAATLAHENQKFDIVKFLAACGNQDAAYINKHGKTVSY